VWLEFDFGSIANPGLVAIVAARGQGATTLQHAILNRMPEATKRRGFVLQPTPEAFVLHVDHVPISYIHDHYDETFLQQLYHFQSDKTSNPMFALFDSVAADPATIRSKLLKQCLCETDKLKWLAILNAQYAMDVPVGIRDHVKWWFISPNKLYDNQRLVQMLEVSSVDASRLRSALNDADKQTPGHFVAVPGKCNRGNNQPLTISVAHVEVPPPMSEETAANRWSLAAFDETKFRISLEGKQVDGKEAVAPTTVGKPIDPEFAILMNPSIVSIAKNSTITSSAASNALVQDSKS
jgi:hypothetical protein